MADGPKSDETVPRGTSTTKDEDDLGKHPGRPRSDGELDPELLRLPKRRTKIGWLLATAVLGFCAYWMITLRHDLAYSRADDQPAQVASADLPSHATEAYVATELVPDRAQTSRVWTGADLGVHAAPAIGTGGAVWLVTSGSAYAGPASYDNSYAGRLKRLGDLPFYDRLRSYYADGEPPLEPVAPAELLASYRSKSSPKTLHGDTISIEPSSMVELTWEPISRVWIVVSPEADGPTNSMEWRAALETRAGFEVRAEIEMPTTGRIPTWTFEVAANDGRAAIASRLAEVGLAAARVSVVREIVSGRWDSLEITDTATKLGGKSLPTGEIGAAMIGNRVVPRADAVVVIAQEQPDDFWYILPLYILFGILILIFGWTLLASLRGSLPATVA